MNPEHTENPNKWPSTQSVIRDWMQKKVRFQVARGWLVASGVVAMVLLLVAID